MTENKQKIRDFLTRHFQNHIFEDDEDMFARNFVNSLFAMQLVIFVEQEFGITIENEDLDIDNFRTISAIAALVERKVASVARPSQPDVANADGEHPQRSSGSKGDACTSN